MHLVNSEYYYMSVQLYRRYTKLVYLDRGNY